TGIGFIPAPVQVLSGRPKLNQEVPREVLRLDLTALFPPEAQEGGFVSAHDDPGVGAADKVAARSRIGPTYHNCFSCSVWPVWVYIARMGQDVKDENQAPLKRADPRGPRPS